MRAISLALAVALVVPASFAAAEGKDGCKCVANGVRYSQGALVCLHLPSGDKLARCGMRLNNSSWEIVREGCQQTSSLAPARPFATATRLSLWRPAKD